MKKVWFITGASKGLGAAIAKQTLAAGHAVVATARDPHSVTAALGEHADLLVCTLDVTDHSHIERAVQAVQERFGRVDVLVNNAGYGLLGYFEELGEPQIRRQMETNFFGPLQLTRALLPMMRQQGSGWIVSVSSTSGARAVEGGAVYSASKFALEGWMEGLQLELAPFGIRCLIMEPGGFRTDFANAQSSMIFADTKIPAYNARRQTLQERFCSYDKKQPGDPNKFAQAMLRMVDAPEAPLRLLCGSYAVASIGEHLKNRLNDMEKWKEVSVSTDFAE